ncbi:hypothetical protein [Streptomyces cinereoruber]|uniref:hypothetical protein n=1 Tax=Streptomyces cinereoruber TaxID=67260 RepID=UPI003C2B4E12
MSDAVGAWKALLPGWCPTVEELRKLDEGAPEFVAAVRAMTADWSPEDARWDVLMALLEYTRREHAHELAEEIRAANFGDPYYVGTGQRQAADLIDPAKGGEHGQQ